MPDDKRRKKPWTGGVGLTKVIQGKVALMTIESTEKLPKYNTIESIVELEIKEDDVNKETQIDEERKRCKISFKNTNFL